MFPEGGERFFQTVRRVRKIDKYIAAVNICHPFEPAAHPRLSQPADDRGRPGAQPPRRTCRGKRIGKIVPSRQPDRRFAQFVLQIQYGPAAAKRIALDHGKCVCRRLQSVKDMRGILPCKLL